jgi:hypothetical protein
MYTTCSNWCSGFTFSGKGSRKNAKKSQISMPNSQVDAATSAKTLPHVQVYTHTYTHTYNHVHPTSSSWLRHIHNIHSPHNPNELWSDTVFKSHRTLIQALFALCLQKYWQQYNKPISLALFTSRIICFRPHFRLFLSPGTAYPHIFLTVSYPTSSLQASTLNQIIISSTPAIRSSQ